MLDELEKNAQLYIALSNYSDPFWLGQRELKKHIKELQLFKERQSLPLLLTCYESFSQDEFLKVLKIVSVITFRYTIIAGLNPNIKEYAYNKSAIRVSNKEIATAAQLAQSLKVLYTSDRDFKNDFSTITLNTKRNKKLIRYILFAIDNRLGNVENDYEDNPATIEHILPENSNEFWSYSFQASIHENFVYRLGNYTLLEEDKNRECSNLGFEEKKIIYQTSQYTMPRQITAAEWTPNTLDNRQVRLATEASVIWRLSYFD